MITAERWKECSRGLSERSERYPRWGINCEFPRTPQGCEDALLLTTGGGSLTLSSDAVRAEKVAIRRSAVPDGHDGNLGDGSYLVHERARGLPRATAASIRVTQRRSREGFETGAGKALSEHS